MARILTRKEQFEFWADPKHDKLLNGMVELKRKGKLSEFIKELHKIVYGSTDEDISKPRDLFQ